MAFQCYAISILFLVVAAAQKQCYWPDHTVATNHTACDESADESWCCDISDICLSNGYCWQQGEYWHSRLGTGTCTDLTWSSAACNTVCSDQGDASFSVLLVVDSADGSFCCGDEYDNTTQACGRPSGGSDPYAPFSVSQGLVIADRSNAATLTYTNTTNTTDGSANTTSVAAESTVTVTVTATAVSNSNIAPVAAGIAAPLGILLIAALVACGILWRKLKQNPKGNGVHGETVGFQEHPQEYSKRDDWAYNQVPQDQGAYKSPGMYNSWIPPPAQATPLEVQHTPVVEAPTSADPKEADGRQL